MRILSVGRALPPHYYDQDQLLAAFLRHWGQRHFNLERLTRLHHAVLVGGRHLALPMEEYEGLERWGQANDAWIRVAQDLGAQAVREALERAGLPPEALGAFFTTTVTGVATPSLDARLMNRLHLPPHLKRVPLFGLGCVAGAAGVARAADYVRAFPDEAALLLSVELCSLTVQREDLSVANLISTGLFGDGAACVVVAGERLAQRLRPPEGAPAWGPQVVASRSVFYPDTERVMGWDITERGFGVVLSAEVPDVVRAHVRADVDAFLAEHALSRADLASYVCHPGGPKVLEAFQEALELPEGALQLTWDSLRQVGNLSSSSVLMVLRDTLDTRRPPEGSYGLMMALGPGFCSELVLLRW